jgi:hypothetical protein
MSSDITQDDAVVEDAAAVDVGTPEPVSEPVELDLTEVVEPVFEEPTHYEPPPEVYQGPSLSDQVRDLGFSDIGSEGEAANRLLESYSQLQNQNQQWADHYQQAVDNQSQQQQHQDYQRAQDYDQYRQWQNQNQSQQQQQQDQENHWWNPPEFSYEEAQQYRQQYQTPEGQLYWDWSPNTPPEVVQGAEDYVKHVEQWTEDLTRRPHEILPQIIETEFDRLFADRYGAVMQWQQQYYDQHQQQRGVQEIHERNADWVYQKDLRTGQYQQDTNGGLVLSQEGQAVTNYINQFRESGVTDPQQLWQLATRMYAGDIATKKMYGQKQQASSQQQALQRNMEHLQRGAEHVPSAGGSIPRPSSPSSQNSRLSAGEKLRLQALEDGLF